MPGGAHANVSEHLSGDICGKGILILNKGEVQRASSWLFFLYSSKPFRIGRLGVGPKLVK